MKRVFVTGASSGIGRAVVDALLKCGHEVWGTSRALARLPQLPQFHPLVLDLCDAASVRDGFAGALSEAGNFDVVINNAGDGHFGAGETISTERLRQQLQTLFLSQVALCQLALADMRPRRQGLIINVTSLATRLPVPFMAGYNAGKAAMASFTMSLQLELAASGIVLVDLQPADIRTGFNKAVTHGEGTAGPNASMQKVWRIVEQNLEAAPEPHLVAQAILRLVESRNAPPRVTVGDLFQATIAPLLDRFLPQRIRLWGLRKYYGI